MVLFQPVRSRTHRLFLAALLAICVGAPVVEIFDQWDRTLQDGNDTEASVVIVALCVGMGFLSIRAILRGERPHRQSRVASTANERTHPVKSALAPPLPTGSPPLALRI